MFDTQSCWHNNEGDDGVKIWNLIEETQFRVPSGPGQRGATTALIWVQHDDEVEDGVIYGTEGGYLISWKEASRKDVKVCFDVGISMGREEELACEPPWNEVGLTTCSEPILDNRLGGLLLLICRESGGVGVGVWWSWLYNKTVVRSAVLPADEEESVLLVVPASRVVWVPFPLLFIVLHVDRLACRSPLHRRRRHEYGSR